MILAVLCSDEKSYFGFDSKNPFKRPVLNKAYSNFAKVGSKKGFKVVFTTWKLVNKGKVSKYWVYDKGWKKSRETLTPDYLFDKFQLGKKQNEAKKKFSRNGKLINSYEMEMFCKDKFLQSKQFSSMAPKTYLISSHDSLKKHMKNISSETAILKPRYGLGGQGILILKKGSSIGSIEFGEDFVLQGLVDSSKGIPSLGVKGVHDLRCVIINGKISYTYVRVPAKGLLANVHQGGTAVLVNAPKEVREKVKKIDSYVKRFGNRVYTADFIRGSLNGKNKFFLVELNSKPGFDVCCRFGFEDVENKFFGQVFEMLKGGKK